MGKYKVGDLVRHNTYKELIYRVEREFMDGTYRIVPINTDNMGKAITCTTEDAMQPYE